MKITRGWLEARKACPEQVKIFTQEWPRGTEITLESLTRAAELGLNLDWLAEELLVFLVFGEYVRLTAPALNEYWKTTAPLRMVAYKKSVFPALIKYYKTIAPELWTETRFVPSALEDFIVVDPDLGL